ASGIHEFGEKDGVLFGEGAGAPGEDESGGDSDHHHDGGKACPKPGFGARSRKGSGGNVRSGGRGCGRHAARSAGGGGVWGGGGATSSRENQPGVHKGKTCKKRRRKGEGG